MSLRNYSSVARATTLTSGVTGSSTSLAVTETTGFPVAPYTLVLDPGRTGEEAVQVTSAIGLTLTVLRGQDGTAAQPHEAGATVRHMATARDFREPNEHINLTTGVHGVTNGLVGTTDVQSLDNKTFLAVSTNHTAVNFRQAVAQTAPLVVFSDSANAQLASVTTAGRLAGPGVDGTGSSTFAANNASTVPLIAKGAASQSAKLLSARSSTNTEVASIGPDGSGTFASTVTTPTVSADTISSVTTTNAGTAVFTAISGDTPLVSKQPVGNTVNSFAVKNSANVVKAGVTSDTTGYQLFHGAVGNLVPFRIHAGSSFMTMLTGATSVSDTIDLTPYGFDVKPIIVVSVVQGEESSTKRRVTANTFNESATAFSIRCFQTNADPMPDNTAYTVRWIAIQATPSGGAG